MSRLGFWGATLTQETGQRLFMPHRTSTLEKKEKGVKISRSGPVLQGGEVLSILFVPRAVAADCVASTTCSKHQSGPKAMGVLCAALGPHAGSVGSPPAATASTAFYLPEL